MTKKVSGHEELRRIAEALDETVLSASPAELREELASEGLEEAKVIAEMDAMLAEAKKLYGKSRLEEAKAAVATRGSETSNISHIDRDRLRGKLDAMQSGASENVEGMMMAARKGKALSKSDEQGALDDLAQLQALENDGDDLE
jgi:hypothetical protein